MNATLSTQCFSQLEVFLQSLVNMGLVKNHEEAIQVSAEMLSHYKFKDSLKKCASDFDAGKGIDDSDEFFEDIIRRGNQRYNKKHNL